MARRSLGPVRPAPAVRTCVGCRARAVKSDLLRLVAAGGDIVPDPQARLPGRGAYLHPSQECFELAQRRKVLSRALRRPAPLGTGRLVDYLAAQGAPSAVRTGRSEGTAAVPGKRDQL